MGKAGEKQKRRPKITDKRQSERFKEAARELGAGKSSHAFDCIVEQMTKARYKIQIAREGLRNVGMERKMSVLPRCGNILPGPSSLREMFEHLIRSHTKRPIFPQP
jgi:hypothetical protein